jgi:hypothetical protein
VYERILISGEIELVIVDGVSRLVGYKEAIMFRQNEKLRNE